MAMAPCFTMETRKLFEVQLVLDGTDVRDGVAYFEHLAFGHAAVTPLGGIARFAAMYQY
jgi:hypothetical protein